MQLGLSDLRISSEGASLGRWRIASRGGGPFGNIGFCEGGVLPHHEHGGLSGGGGYPLQAQQFSQGGEGGRGYIKMVCNHTVIRDRILNWNCQLKYATSSY